MSAAPARPDPDLPGEVDAPPLVPVRTADVTPLPNRGADLRIVLGPRSGGAREGLLVVASIAPGQVVREHYHPYSEERVIVLSGTLELTLGRDRYEIPEGTAFVVPRGVRHRMGTVGDAPVEAVFTMSPLAPRPEWGHVDTEQVEPL